MSKDEIINQLKEMNPVIKELLKEKTRLEKELLELMRNEG